MKKLIIYSILGILLLGNSAYAQQDAINAYFETYANDERFSNIFISKKMFKMFAKLPKDGDEEELLDIIGQLDGLRILSSSEVDGMSMYKEAFTKLSGNKFEELMSIRDGGQELKFLIKEGDGKVKELLMISGETNNFFILSLVGNIDLKQISKLSTTMDIKGMDNLKNLEKE